MQTLDLVANYIGRIRVANISLNGGDIVVRTNLIIPRAMIKDYKKVYEKDKADPNEFWYDLNLEERLRSLPSEYGWKNELNGFLNLVRQKYEKIEARFSELKAEFGVNPAEEIALEIRPKNPTFNREVRSLKS